MSLDPIPGFNLRAAVVGHGGQYVKHIQQETRCRVQIKGRGSGFKEHGTEESDEPLYLHVTYGCVIRAFGALLTFTVGPIPMKLNARKNSAKTSSRL